MAGGWLVVVGPACWGSGERVRASGGFSPPCLKRPSVQELRGGGFPVSRSLSSLFLPPE